MSGNENSDDENSNNKFLNRIKEIKEKQIQNSPSTRKSPTKMDYFSPTDLIKEISNEAEFEESIDNHNDNANDNSNNIKNSTKSTNQKPAWNNNRNSKNNNNSGKQIIMTNHSNNTEINNKRFEIDPSENKRSVVSSYNKGTPTNTSYTNVKLERPSSTKHYKKKSIL
jgi:hypothetical protein